MITNEEIVAKLTEKRNKDAKTVTDKWITERAKRLMTKVTEESVLEDILSDSMLDMEDAQKLANSVLAAEVKRIKELEKTPTPPTPQTPPENSPAIPKEVQEFMEKYNAAEAKKALEEKRNGIYEKLKTKVNESQRNVLKKIVEMQQLAIENDDDEISETIMATFTDFQKELAGDTTPHNPAGTPKEEDLKKSYELKMKQHGIGLN